MKHAFLHCSCAAVLGYQPAVAQFVALPDSDASWIVVHDNFGTSLDATYNYYLDPVHQDTLINDTTYSVLMATIYPWADPPSFAGGLYDNGAGQVYYYHPISGHAYLIYDFDVQVGDSVPVFVVDFNYPAFSMMMYIAAVDTIDIAGSPRKAIGIQSWFAILGNQGIVHWWIEGIGGTGGLLSSIGVLPLDYSGGLWCMSANDTVWWSGGPLGAPGICFNVGIAEHLQTGTLRMAPNPTNGLCTIDLPQSLRATDGLVLSVYDNTGVLVQRTPLEFREQGVKLDVRAQAKGVYHVELSDGQQRYSGSIVFE